MNDPVNEDTMFDTIVVGSGGAGLVAACVAADRGLRVLVLESTSQLGGTTAISGGHMWVPENPVMLAAGYKDSRVAARTYLERISLGATPNERLESFLSHGPQLVNYLSELGIPLFCVERPDYHPEWEGAGFARTLEPLPIEAGGLGEWEEKVRRSPSRPPITSTESRTGIGAEEVDARRKRGVRTQGAGLVAGLVLAALRRGVTFRIDASVSGLSRNEEGWSIEVGGLTPEAFSSRTVILAAGGFARNHHLRSDFLPLVGILPTAAVGSQGDGLKLGIRAGGYLHGMSEAWWTAATYVPGETVDDQPAYRNVVRELAYPGSILVNRAGKRFVNEASSYNDLGKAFFQFDPATHRFPNSEAWLIFDSTFRATRSVLGIRPQDEVPAWFTSAETIEDLAAKLSIDPSCLLDTIETFNIGACVGIDKEFGRGDNAHDRFNGDENAPNACLGEIQSGPFYAIPIHLGANGTKGGLAVDAAGHVLTADFDQVDGLFAVGETASALMGPGYAGSGASLGPALTAAYVLAHRLPVP